MTITRSVTVRTICIFFRWTNVDFVNGYECCFDTYSVNRFENYALPVSFVAIAQVRGDAGSYDIWARNKSTWSNIRLSILLTNFLRVFLRSRILFAQWRILLSSVINVYFDKAIGRKSKLMHHATTSFNQLELENHSPNWPNWPYHPRWDKNEQGNNMTTHI